MPSWTLSKTGYQRTEITKSKSIRLVSCGRWKLVASELNGPCPKYTVSLFLYRNWCAQSFHFYISLLILQRPRYTPRDWQHDQLSLRLRRGNIFVFGVQ